MDNFNFNSLVDEAAQRAQDEGVKFENALTSVLSEENDDAQTGGISLMSDVPQNTYANDQAMLTTIDHLVLAMRAVLPVQMDAVLKQDHWEETDNESYPYEYRYSGTVFQARKRTDMYIQAQSSDTAMNAGIYAVTGTQDGYVSILSKRIPDDDLAVTFIVSTALCVAQN